MGSTASAISANPGETTAAAATRQLREAAGRPQPTLFTALANLATAAIAERPTSSDDLGSVTLTEIAAAAANAGFALVAEHASNLAAANSSIGPVTLAELAAASDSFFMALVALTGGVAGVANGTIMSTPPDPFRLTLATELSARQNERRELERELVGAHGDIREAKELVMRRVKQPGPTLGLPSYAISLGAFLRAVDVPPTAAERAIMAADAERNRMLGMPATLEALESEPSEQMTITSERMLVEAWFCSGNVDYLRRLRTASLRMPREGQVRVNILLSQLKTSFPDLSV